MDGMRNTCSAAAVWSVRVVCLCLVGGTAALGQTREVKSLAQITVDDEGRELSYPSALFYDRSEQELYLVNGGTSRVVVYGPDFFPLASMGAGHGVNRPGGGYVARDGLIYVCQSATPANPARVTVLNGAFFPVREIFFDEVPGTEGFRPTRVAVSRDGLLYVAGAATRGVLVLDQDGTLLRRLEPLDEIFNPEAVLGGDSPPEPPELADASSPGEDQLPEPPEAAAPDGGSRFDIPEEFRPKSRQEREAPAVRGLGPVRVGSVTIDADDKLYLVSAETSKVYVYDASETFLFSFGEKGGTPRKLSQPRGLAIDEKRGLLYVVDYMRHTILVYDRDGKFQFEVGGRGTGPGWFNFPVDVVVNPQGQVIVADLFNRRVQVLEVEHSIGPPLVERRAPAAGPGGESEVREPARMVERGQSPEPVPEAPAEVPAEILDEPPPPWVEEGVLLPE